MSTTIRLPSLFPLKLVATLAGRLLSFSSLEACSSEKLNVLIFFIDDLRPESGCYDAEYIKSPHIDTLASAGVLFRFAQQ